MSSEFKQYRRRATVMEARPYIAGENLEHPYVPFETRDLPKPISISAADLAAGSPKPGDMIARAPDNHSDQWLVNAEFFAKNYETEPVEG